MKTKSKYKHTKNTKYVIDIVLFLYETYVHMTIVIVVRRKPLKLTHGTNN